jgi:glycosyltransferase involved in cell wall biosynthesis
VLAQSYTDIEHIIVDGASTDNTMAIVREYEPLYHGRLRYISEPDHGIYDAMNKGMAMASGDVIGILNSDDFFTGKEVVNILMQPFLNDVKGSVDAVYSNLHYVDPNDTNKVVRYYSSRGFRPWHMLMGFQPAHPTFYCRKEVYDRFLPYDTDLKIASDFDMLLRMIYIGRISSRYINYDCVAMRFGSTSTSGFKAHVQIMRDHIMAYRKNRVRSNRFIDALRYLIKGFDMLLQRLKLKKW